MKLYLIRHGEIAGDPHEHYAPPVSGCLSVEGQAQARMLGEALGDIEFHRVIASPLGRAIETAQALRSASGRIDIREWAVEWQPSEFLKSAGNTVWEEMMDRMRLLRVEETWLTEAGEGHLEMAGRVVPGILSLLREEGISPAHGGFLVPQEAENRTLALVAHGGSLNVLCQYLLHVPLSPRPCVSFDLTGVAVFEFIRRVDVWYPVLKLSAPAAGH